MPHRCQSILRASNGRLLAQVASVSADFADGQVIPEHSHPEDQLLFASQGVMTLRTSQELGLSRLSGPSGLREHQRLHRHVVFTIERRSSKPLRLSEAPHSIDRKSVV